MWQTWVPMYNIEARRRYDDSTPVRRDFAECLAAKIQLDRRCSHEMGKWTKDPETPELEYRVRSTRSRPSSCTSNFPTPAFGLSSPIQRLVHRNPLFQSWFMSSLDLVVNGFAACVSSFVTVQSSHAHDSIASMRGNPRFYQSLFVW